MQVLKTLLSQKKRAWFYRVVSTAAPLLAFYGLMSHTAAALWVAFIGAVLGTGLAAAKTNPKEPV